MKTKTKIKSKNKKAEYSVRWETIYANSDITDDELDKFKEQIEKEGYKVLHIVK